MPLLYHHGCYARLARSTPAAGELVLTRVGIAAQRIGRKNDGVATRANTVNGSLYCTGNNPDPIDYGAINTVSGTASGQCAAIAER